MTNSNLRFLYTTEALEAATCKVELIPLLWVEEIPDLPVTPQCRPERQGTARSYAPIKVRKLFSEAKLGSFSGKSLG